MTTHSQRMWRLADMYLSDLGPLAPVTIGSAREYLDGIRGEFSEADVLSLCEAVELERLRRTDAMVTEHAGIIGDERVHP